MCACMMCGEGNESSIFHSGKSKGNNLKLKSSKIHRLEHKGELLRSSNESNGEMRGRWVETAVFNNNELYRNI